MIPLEMKGMVRYCHPPTPRVGLCRQSGNHELTLQYYRDAVKMRNLCYFPSMLRKMTVKCTVYRLIRRLWIKAICCILRDYCPCLVPTILDTLSDRIEPYHISFPTYFTKFHEIHLHYDSLSTPLRFKQMLGQLVHLGYPDREMIPVDYEYESYLSKFPPDYHRQIMDLYQQLTQKKIKQKWHIVLSYLPFHLQYDVDYWNYRVTMKRLLLTLHAFHRRYSFTSKEYTLMIFWIERMKYPSH
jgi:hypothetical protein